MSVSGEKSDQENQAISPARAEPADGDQIELVAADVTANDSAQALKEQGIVKAGDDDDDGKNLTLAEPAEKSSLWSWFPIEAFTWKNELDAWDTENTTFWEKYGKAIANKNLWISIPNLLLGFAVWLVWSIVTVLIQVEFSSLPCFGTFRKILCLFCTRDFPPLAHFEKAHPNVNCFFRTPVALSSALVNEKVDF